MFSLRFCAHFIEKTLKISPIGLLCICATMACIGLNLTSHTQYYPVGTFSALVVGLGSGLILMPRFGIEGAAIAFLLSALTQTTVSFIFAQRFYKIRYEIGRVARVIASGVIAALAGLWLVPAWPPLAGLIGRATVTVGTFAALIAVSGFLRRTERAFAAELIAGLRRRTAKAPIQSGHDA